MHSRLGVLKNTVPLIPNIVDDGAAHYYLAEYYLKKSCRYIGGATRRSNLFLASILLTLRVSSRKLAKGQIGDTYESCV